MKNPLFGFRLHFQDSYISFATFSTIIKYLRCLFLFCLFIFVFQMECSNGSRTTRICSTPSATNARSICSTGCRPHGVISSRSNRTMTNVVSKSSYLFVNYDLYTEEKKKHSLINQIQLNILHLIQKKT